MMESAYSCIHVCLNFSFMLHWLPKNIHTNNLQGADETYICLHLLNRNTDLLVVRRIVILKFAIFETGSKSIGLKFQNQVTSM
jgi:hypothetical protein